MDHKEQELYDQIMQGGYGNIKVDGLMIMGNIEVLKNLLLVQPTVRLKSRDQHLSELGDLDEDDKAL